MISKLERPEVLDDRDAGMTMTELLVTTALLGIIATVIAAAVTVVFRSESGVFDVVAESHDIQQAVNYFHIDVESGPARTSEYLSTGNGCSDAAPNNNILRFDTDPDGDLSDADFTDDRRIAYQLTTTGTTSQLDRFECAWNGATWDETSVRNVADRLDASGGPPVAVTVVPDANQPFLVDRVEMTFGQTTGSRTVSAAPRAEAGLLALGIGDCAGNPLDAALGFGSFVEGDSYLDNTAGAVSVEGSFAVGGRLGWKGNQINLLANIGEANNTLSGVNQVALYASAFDWPYGNSPLEPTSPNGVLATFGSSKSIIGGVAATDYWVQPGTPLNVFGTSGLTGARLRTQTIAQPSAVTPPVDFAKQFEILRACANALASMPYNSAHEYADVTYQAAGTRLRLAWGGGNNAKVLNIPESYLIGVNEITLGSSVGASKPLVVNIAESTDESDPAGEDFDDDITLDLDLPPLTPSTYKRVIYNFTNMEGVVTIRRDIAGTVFAPFATVVTEGNVNGAVIAKTWIHRGDSVQNGTNHVFNASIDWSAPPAT